MNIELEVWINFISKLFNTWPPHWESVCQRRTGAHPLPGAPSNEIRLPRHPERFPLKLILQIISFRWFHRGIILFIKLNRRSPQIVLSGTLVGRFSRSKHTYYVVSWMCHAESVHRANGPTHMILIPSRVLGYRQAYKIRIIFSFRGLPASATSSLIKTNSCLTQSYPAICEVLQAELRPQIILTPFNKAVMLIQSCRI